MDALEERLVRREHGLIQLLDPPFDKSALIPGYIIDDHREHAVVVRIPGSRTDALKKESDIKMKISVQAT